MLLKFYWLILLVAKIFTYKNYSKKIFVIVHVVEPSDKRTAVPMRKNGKAKSKKNEWVSFGRQVVATLERFPPVKRLESKNRH